MMGGVVATDELHSHPPNVRPLELIRSVASRLEESRVRYCHWKSNAAIDRSATGDNDLDLLVLGRQANIRYVTGTPQLWTAGTRPFGPGCVLVRESGDREAALAWFDKAIKRLEPVVAGEKRLVEARLFRWRSVEARG